MGRVLPGINEVLSHTDARWRACDRDLAHGGSISGAGYFDVSSWYLANLIDLTALSANNAANELGEETAEVKEMYVISFITLI